MSGEIPGILNIGAHCEPIARCPVDFLCRFPLVIFKHAAQSFPAPHRSVFRKNLIVLGFRLVAPENSHRLQKSTRYGEAV